MTNSTKCQNQRNTFIITNNVFVLLFFTTFICSETIPICRQLKQNHEFYNKGTKWERKHYCSLLSTVLNNIFVYSNTEFLNIKLWFCCCVISDGHSLRTEHKHCFVTKCKSKSCSTQSEISIFSSEGRMSKTKCKTAFLCFCAGKKIGFFHEGRMNRDFHETFSGCFFFFCMRKFYKILINFSLLSFCIAFIAVAVEIDFSLDFILSSSFLLRKVVSMPSNDVKSITLDFIRSK